MSEPAADGELEQLRRDLEAARARADAYLDLAQRGQADLVNYRRRVEAERRADAQRARAEAVEALLPLLDDLDRALAHAPESLRENPWAKGIALVAGRLGGTLARLGVERVGRVGEPFDPTVHEALAAEPRAGVEPGHVAEVVRTGYRSGERLIRPAQVVVGAQGGVGPGGLLDERV